MELKFSTCKVHNEWEVQIKVSPYLITSATYNKITSATYNKNDYNFLGVINDIEQWCNNSFGPAGRNPRYRWRKNWLDKYPIRFYFKNEKDLTAFLLRWS